MGILHEGLRIEHGLRPSPGLTLVHLSSYLWVLSWFCYAKPDERIGREKGQAKPDYITAEGFIILRRRTEESQESELSEAKFAKFFWDILSF